MHKLLFPHFGAFESTKIHGSGLDIIETTGHLHKWREDLDLLRSAGVRDLRYAAPWHRIEKSPGSFDFSWMDKPMQHIRRHGMDPVIDLLHHTSFPDWLENGFANPAFPELFRRFTEQFARRYEWVERYTLFNEPLATTLLSAHMGVWYPYRQSDRAFAQVAWNVAHAIQMADQALRKVRGSFASIYMDTCEHHKALDRESEAWVRFANHRRFLMLDLVLGRVEQNHPLLSWMTTHGVSSDQLQQLQNCPARIDVLGLDYYPHSEMEWIWNGGSKRADIRWPNMHPRGFARVARDYIRGYGMPVMLGETNIRGTVSDRLTWLRFMQEQCETLVHAKVDFRGFCWFPSIDSTDWSNLCARSTGAVDPQGIWYLDEHRVKRYSSELSEYYGLLASGSAIARDLPAYRFLAPLDRELSGYTRLMSHWDNWIEPDVNGSDVEEKAA